MSTVSRPDPSTPVQSTKVSATNTPSPAESLPPAPTLGSVFTIVGGTTIPDHAEIVRSHCREGSTVELRRDDDDPDAQSGISVWLLCSTLLGLVSVRKKIGHVPVETADLLEPLLDESATVVARGTVRTVYAPMGRDEAVVTVEITPTGLRLHQLTESKDDQKPAPPHP